MSDEKHELELSKKKELLVVEDIKYTVWVGGTEVVDRYTTYDEAKKVADEYIEKGYGDDVKIDTKGKDKK